MRTDVNQCHGSAATSPSAMLKQGLVRFSVPEGQIAGEWRHVLEKARRWLQLDLNLADFIVEYFTVAPAVYDRRDQLAEAQAELGQALDTESHQSGGYVAHNTPTVANLRADQSLNDMLKALVHEARHSKQLTDFDWMQPSSRESDAEYYTAKTLSKMLEEIRRR